MTSRAIGLGKHLPALNRRFLRLNCARYEKSSRHGRPATQKSRHMSRSDQSETNLGVVADRVTSQASMSRRRTRRSARISGPNRAESSSHFGAIIRWALPSSTMVLGGRNVGSRWRGDEHTGDYLRVSCGFAHCARRCSGRKGGLPEGAGLVGTVVFAMSRRSRNPVVNQSQSSKFCCHRRRTLGNRILVKRLSEDAACNDAQFHTETGRY